ncbi:MAG TPA: class I SAM-dependent methyltransferase [Acidimicrobiales bacterium]|nr:class I SAM-dependent methyltransferase [Acidimicrobiales bacterium]
MTELNTGVQASTGWDETAAADWAARDESKTELTTPWNLTAVITASEGHPVSRILDVASGPGGFLQTLLERLSDASGVWYDFSETMRTEAMRNLAHLEGRVEYRIGDIVDLDAAGPKEAFDLVTTSRATHHLTVFDLGRFYSQAAERLRPGGFIANLDNLNPGEPWSGRLRAARAALRGPRPSSPSNHPHLVPAPSMEDHLACIRAAGFEPALVVWRNLSSGLLIARKPD